MKKIQWLDWLFIGTLLFFALSLIHISLALLGFICVLTPFILYFKTGEKLWCTKYCPRAALFTKFLSKIALNKTAPKWLFTAKTKRLVLGYFCLNIFFATMSTLMVALGRIEPMAHVRFMIAFQVPMQLPQLLHFIVPDFVVHLAYRIFSIMFTSTIIGLYLGVLYKPRTWCAICPIQTLTTPVKPMHPTLK